MSLKPICVPCERFMRPERTAVAFIEGKPHGGIVPWDGKSGRTSVGWTPYKLWRGDQWRCPDCDATIIVGVAQAPVVEHYEDRFSLVVKALNVTLFIKDC